MLGKRTRLISEDEQAPTVWERQWRMLQMFVNNHEGKTLKELANELGVGVLTVKRDMSILQSVFGKFLTRNLAHGEKAYFMDSNSFSFAVKLNGDEMA